MIPFGDLLKAWLQKRAQNNSPEMVEAKKAQVEQTFKDTYNTEITEALDSKDSAKKEIALRHIREQLS